MEWTKCYAKLSANPDDFEQWKNLLDASDSLGGGLNKGTAESDVQLFRFSYDNFLERFPLAFGFWIKYAETEFMLGNTEGAEAVFERGVGSNQVSVELWAAYARFKTKVCHNVDKMRAFLERAVGHVGTHFYAHSIWDVYVEFERKQAEIATENKLARLAELLSRIVRIPMHQYAKYFDLLRDISRQLKPEEAGWIKKGKDKSINNIYVSTQAETARRWAYEQAFPRQYFHVLFVKEEDLQAWRRYLDFEESEGSLDRVRVLYERAIIATSHNEEMWLRYIRFMQTVTSSLRIHREEVSTLFRRACALLPIGRLEVRHLYAAHCESLGELALAHDIYMSILGAFPNSIQTILLFVNFERRYAYSQFLAQGKSVKKQAAVHQAVQLLTQYLDDENSLRNKEKCEILQLLVDYLQVFPGQAPANVRDILARYQPLLEAEYKFWRLAMDYEVERVQKPAKDVSAESFTDTLAELAASTETTALADEKSKRLSDIIDKALESTLRLEDKRALLKRYLAYSIDQASNVKDYEKYSAVLYNLGGVKTTPSTEPLDKPGDAATTTSTATATPVAAEAS